MNLKGKRPITRKTQSCASIRLVCNILLGNILLLIGIGGIEGLLPSNAIAQDFGEDFNQIDRTPEPEAAPPPPATPAAPPVDQTSFEPPPPPPAPIDYGSPAPAPAPISTPAPTPIPAGPPSEPILQRISVGDVIPGVLGRADYLDAENRRVELYQFTGQANDAITITLTNSNDPRPDGLPLSPYMRVLNLSAPEGQQVIGGTFTPGAARTPSENPLVPVDNQVDLRLPQSGEYGIVVYTDPGVEGRYGLSVIRDRTRYFVDTSDELTDETATLNSDNSPFSAAEFYGRQGQTVHINLTSSDFDSYLFLVDANGDVIAEDNNSGGNLNARIVTELPEDGAYYVIVNSRNSEGRGRYRLTIY